MFLISSPLPIGRLCCEEALPVGWEHLCSRFCWKMSFNKWTWLAHKAKQTSEKWLDPGSKEIQLLSFGRWILYGGLEESRRKKEASLGDNSTRETDWVGKQLQSSYCVWQLLWCRQLMLTWTAPSERPTSSITSVNIVLWSESIGIQINKKSSLVWWCFRCCARLFRNIKIDDIDAYAKKCYEGNKGWLLARAFKMASQWHGPWLVLRCIRDLTGCLHCKETLSSNIIWSQKAKEKENNRMEVIVRQWFSTGDLCGHFPTPKGHLTVPKATYRWISGMWQRRCPLLLKLF